MNKEHIPVITDREELYDKCENMEELYDKYYLPLLDIHYRKTYELQQENKILRENAENNDKVVDKVNWENRLLKQQNKKYKEVIDKAINNSQYWIDYYTKLNSDERIALRLQENIDILKEVKE